MDRVHFLFDTWEPVTRILVVGTLAYVALVLLLRVASQRTQAQMSAFDFIVTVALGASFGRILTARSVALVEAVTAFAVLIVLQFVVSWTRVRFPAVERVITAPPALLFFRGEFMQGTMRRKRVTESGLRAVLREHGIASLSEVEAIVLEANGHFAVVRTSTADDAFALTDLNGR